MAGALQGFVFGLQTHDQVTGPDGPAGALGTDAAAESDPDHVWPRLTTLRLRPFGRHLSEPYWDALAEAAFQRRFHRPRSYLHPQTSSLDHYHRLLTALLRRRTTVTSTLLAQLLNVGRTNLSNQFQDGHRLLDLHRVAVTPLPGTPARTLTQLQALLPSRDDT
ncbi:hypothetical protein ABTY63_33710 [Streptomyces solisilvae]|uniref:hypothetical protein n=1 Tax=Streptomyces malaysiensis TaxID=92644 RepID=UPI003332E8D8